MVIIASKERSRRVQGSPPGDLRLQVVGSARDGQIVELTAAKCAIGSASGCTLRLRARGVRPVHCLILRGAHGTVARAWAPNTRINGQPFGDALLEAGDRLSIGPVEFEVLPAKEGPLADPTDAGRTVVFDRRPAANRLQSEPLDQASSRRAHRRAQVHTLVTEVRRLRSQIERAALMPQPAETPFAADASHDLHARLDAYKQQNEHWEATLQGLQGELDSRERQLAELDAARETFDDERKQWETELETTRSQLATYRDAALLAEETLALVQAEAEQAERNTASQTKELNALRQELKERETELAAALDRHAVTADRVGLLDQRAAELEEQARQFAEEHAAWQQSQGDDRQAAEELRQARETFEAQQAEAWREIEAQRACAAALEAEHRESLVETQRRAGALTEAEMELAERQAAHSEVEAKLLVERQGFADERSAQEAEFRQRAESLQLQFAELATKQNALTAREEELQTAFAALSSQSAPAADSGAVEEIAAQQAELEQKLADFARERQEWEATLEHRTQQLERAQLELQTERRQFDVDRESSEQQILERMRELEDQQRQFAEHALSQPAVAEPNAEERQHFEEQQAEFERAQAELAEEREALESQRQKTSDRLDAEAREIERERRELDAARAAFKEERQAAQEREEPEPVSRGWQVEPDDDTEEDESPAPTRHLARATSETDTVRGIASEDDTARQTPPGGDEESIEQYMAALLNRMRGGEAAQPLQPNPEAPRRNNRKSDAPQAVSREPVPEAAAEPESPAPLLDMPTVLKELERRQSNELPGNLNVLREIGITHARSAIETHGQQRSLRQAYGTLATSIFCFVAALAVFYFSKTAASHPTATTILVIGIFWMGTSMWAVKKVFSSMRKKRSGLRSMMQEIEAEIALMEKERAAAARQEE